MPEIGPEHPITYRQEIVAPLFRAVLAGESCAVVGPASMGKSRLIQFLLRPDVQQHYLDDQAATTLLVLADGNRLAEVTEWGLYELLLTSLTEASGRHPDAQPLRAEFNALRRETITSRDPILARRHVELAAHMLCQEQGLKLCFIMDEFDESYRTLPAPALNNLRALRDINKYRLCYVLAMREPPARLRPPAECEGFYELFSRTILGLGPYTEDDAGRMIQQLEARKDRALQEPARSQLLHLSGGHPGLILALFDVISNGEMPDGDDWQAWALAQPTIQEECRKLWEGLADDERLVLSHLVQGIDASHAVLEVLKLKGLVCLQNGEKSLFSPVFAGFVQTRGAPAGKPLWVDEAGRVLWIGEQPFRDLTALEFDLVAFLYRHVGEVCTRDQILADLYPDEYHDENVGLEDSRVDALVKRVRRKIEPAPQRPRYLLTVRGKGYKLVATPEEGG